MLRSYRAYIPAQLGEVLPRKLINKRGEIFNAAIQANRLIPLPGG
ncbi:hypothetical protein BvCmsJ76A_02318 [Escherichia coli]|nr:hypothetical protein BvCmsJ76A_02318 [Escherichia coli]